MSRPYSYDFRRRVIEAVELDGLKKREACELFHISRNTLHLWLQRKAETGDVRAKAQRTPARQPIIQDWEKFRVFVQQHPDKTQAELAQLWESDISPRSVCRALKRIGFTRKKRLTATVNATRKSESAFANS